MSVVILLLRSVPALLERISLELKIIIIHAILNTWKTIQAVWKAIFFLGCSPFLLRYSRLHISFFIHLRNSYAFPNDWSLGLFRQWFCLYIDSQWFSPILRLSEHAFVLFYCGFLVRFKLWDLTRLFNFGKSLYRSLFLNGLFDFW